MSRHNFTSEIHKLRKRDLPEITEHLLRLDPETRRMRFGNAVSDDYIRTYAERMFDGDSVVFGAFPDGQLRGISEMHELKMPGRADAEVALSVEPDWQNRGIGSALFERIVTAARNRFFDSLHVLFLHENKRMQRIAEKHHPKLEFHNGEVEATFDPPWPTPISFAKELADDTSAYVRTVFQLAA